jgi:hypothetical protein
MHSLTFQSHVGRDGILKLEVPAGFADKDVEIVLIIQELATAPEARPEGEVWPPRFFEDTFGCMREEPMERDPQGEREKREEPE